MAVKMLRRMDTAGLAENFPLPKGRYGVGLSWDALQGKPKIDLDLQCVVVDASGSIIDCAYYNNMKAVRAITHSGDERTGDRDGIDELVWVHADRVPANVACLIFVIAAYSGGKLQDVANGVFHVFEESKSKEIARFDVERSPGAVDVVAVMHRHHSGWNLRIIDEPAQQGQHFMDILPLLCETIRLFIPSAPRRQKVAFAMEKGGILDLPKTLDSITVGLGWDVDHGEVDLDVSAVLLDTNLREVETVFFGNLESARNGVLHTGDNLTGHGSGDDEQIRINLMSVQPHVQHIVFVVNIYSRGYTFRQVANPYCRVVDNASDDELCRYMLSEAGHENGLVVAKIMREAGGRWGFHALGLPCRGTMYKDSLPYVRQLCQTDTRCLMARGGTRDLDRVPMPRTTAQARPQQGWVESSSGSESEDATCHDDVKACAVQ